jgi:hypothetical protein
MSKTWSRIALSALVASASWGVAWAADEVHVNTGEPEQRVTVVKESGSTHEAVVNIRSEAPSEVIVKAEPPKPKTDSVVMESRPGKEYVWVSGYWRWDTDRSTYEWVDGVWRRQVPGMVWQAGRWERTPKGYVWIAGSWAPEKAVGKRVKVVKEAPPAPMVEAKTTSPGPDYMWVPGRWGYENGKYAWVSGRWERPANQDMVYIPGEWMRRGDGFVYIAGRWDYPEENRSSVARLSDMTHEEVKRERARDRFRDDERNRDPLNF